MVIEGKESESEASSAVADPPGREAFALPARPLHSIRPSRGWVALDLRSLWAWRELFFFLIWRDVKVRYKQTVLGVAWAVLQPLLTMLVFTLFFGRLAGLPSDGIPYPLFAYAGLLPWSFFSNAVTNSGNSLVGNANLITKVYFPRVLVPAAAVGAGLVDMGVAFLLLVAMFAYYRVALTWSLLMLPVLVSLLTLVALGVGMWASALNVKYRDVRYALPFGIQLWMFATPIIYPMSLVPAKWRWVLLLNPLAGLIEGFRAALFGRPFDFAGLGLSVVLTCALLASALYSFRAMEREFADVI